MKNRKDLLQLSVGDMQNTPTLTVGIPAHNEEANIINLLHSILKQKSELFVLESIIVSLDACTDRTEELLKQFAENNPLVTVLNDGKRIGKVGRLNQLYQKNTSEFLLTIDADVLLEREDEIERLVKRFADPKIQVVAANQEPIKPQKFIPKIIYHNYLLWNEIRKTIAIEDHIANLYGSATLLRRSFAKNVTYPAHITADYDYLYMMAKRVDGFAYEKSTRVLYATPETISEMRLVGTRLHTEREDLRPLFGDSVQSMHAISITQKLLGVLNMLRKSPFYTALGIALLISIRIVPEVDEMRKHGLWKVASTTKQAIHTVIFLSLLLPLIHGI